MTELVAAASAAMAGWPDPDNGQVRATPDERTLRWYSTIGLMDRPVSWRGRTALYGDRHLLQVLAIKRLQLAEWAIAAIQARLIGIEDHDLSTIAVTPGKIAPPPSPSPSPKPSQDVAAFSPAPVRSARRNTAFWDAPAAPPALSAEHRQLIDLGQGATLMLPTGLTLSADLELALKPLQAWLAAQSPASVHPQPPGP